MKMSKRDNKISRCILLLFTGVGTLALYSRRAGMREVMMCRSVCACNGLQDAWVVNLVVSSATIDSHTVGTTPESRFYGQRRNRVMHAESRALEKQRISGEIMFAVSVAKCLCEFPCVL